MSNGVKNGGVGKSPSIDKINQTFSRQLKTLVPIKINALVCQKTPIYRAVPIVLQPCKLEMRGQIANLFKKHAVLKKGAITATKAELIAGTHPLTRDKNTNTREDTKDTRQRELFQKFGITSEFLSSRASTGLPEKLPGQVSELKKSDTHLEAEEYTTEKDKMKLFDKFGVTSKIQKGDSPVGLRYDEKDGLL